MEFANLSQFNSRIAESIRDILSQPETFIQAGIILLIYGFCFVLANKTRKHLPRFVPASQPFGSSVARFIDRFASVIFPIIAIVLLRLSVEASRNVLSQAWLLEIALTLAVLLLVNNLINDFVRNAIIKVVFRWLGLPLIFLHMIGILDDIVLILDSMAISLGNIELSAYDLLSVIIFGSMLFWFGRVSNSTGKEIIRRQENLDFRTREVAAKMLEIVIFTVIFLLLLQIMGINLTTLAVFGGAVGVGLGFGLQAIASNFISGIILLLDRSVSIGDYVELEDGRTGIVRELNMRSMTLETFDGKDIMVPNEKFIVESFTNWTHQNKKQRYRVDFSVAYNSNIRKLVEIIKEVVASHPRVLSGEAIPIEERPDCEIQGFGDSGINMFVEFWMEGIDDGKNRVSGDLLLMILEALQEHGYEIPFPQREVRVLNEKFKVDRPAPAA
jgi:small-conductance mechanosensitive channel